MADSALCGPAVPPHSREASAPHPLPFLILFTFPVLAQILPSLWRWLDHPSLQWLLSPWASGHSTLKWVYYLQRHFRRAVIRTEWENRRSMTGAVPGIGLPWVPCFSLALHWLSRCRVVLGPLWLDASSILPRVLRCMSKRFPFPRTGEGTLGGKIPSTIHLNQSD